MTLRVHTARMGSRDPDWLDITRGGNEKRGPGGHRGIGMAFAPSRKLLDPLLSKRRSGTLSPPSWREYSEAYTAEMRRSYVVNRAAWDTLLSWDRVVLLCFCTDPNRCHRTLLAKILGKLGAEWTTHTCARDRVVSIDDEMRRVSCVCGHRWTEIGPLLMHGRSEMAGPVEGRPVPRLRETTP